MKKMFFFHLGSDGGIRFSNKDENEMQRTLLLFRVFSILVLVVNLILVVRLFKLTVVRGSYYKNLANGNRSKEIVIEAKRGMIVDRKGIKMARNLDAGTNISAERIKSKRVYYFPESASHVIGYRSQASEDDIKHDICITKARSGDKIGKLGVEKLFDCELRGKNGKQLVETDASGKPLRTLSVINPIEGKRIQLSIDSWLQNKAYQLIKNKKATVVGLIPKTGEVVVLTSSPGFSSQAFEDDNKEQIKDFYKTQIGQCSIGLYREYILQAQHLN